MNGNIKRYIYIIGTICIVFLLGSILIRNLPWILLVGFITYIVMKIVGFAKGKKQQKNENKFDFNNRSDSEDSHKESTDDYTTGEVIDVEYEEVDKNK
jgi:hypothetical protein